MTDLEVKDKIRELTNKIGRVATEKHKEEVLSGQHTGSPINYLWMAFNVVKDEYYAQIEEENKNKPIHKIDLLDLPF